MARYLSHLGPALSLESSRLRAVICASCLWLLAAPLALAQPSAKRATATRLSGPAPHIDGRIDDGAWAGAMPIEDFGQQSPIEGAPPSERTIVLIRYDDEALYIGARMFRRNPKDIARSIRSEEHTSELQSPC